MKIFCLLSLFLSVSAACLAQDLPRSPNKTNAAGQREGQWTIWYTKAGKPTENPGSVFYHRRISYQKDKPVGLVKDFYRSGKVRWEGRLLADRPEEIMDGKAIWYYPNGNKELERVYKEGKAVEEVSYTPDGEIEEEVKWSNPGKEQLTGVAFPGGFALPFSDIKNEIEVGMKNEIEGLPDSLYDSNMKEVLKEHLPDYIKELGRELGDPAYFNSIRDQFPDMLIKDLQKEEGSGKNFYDPSASMRLLCNQLNSYIKTGKAQEAEEMLIELRQNQMDVIQENTFLSLPEMNKAMALKSMAYISEYFNFFVLLRQAQNPAIAGRMYNYQLATKALLFNANYRIRELIMNSQDTALKQNYQRWLDLKDDWSKTDARSQTKLVNETKLNEFLTLERQIGEQSAAFATAVDRKQYTWQDVQRQLKPSEAAIEIVRFRRYAKDWTDTVHYAALIVTPSTKLPQLVLLENGNDLEGKYALSYQNAIRTGQPSRGVKPDSSNYILAATADSLHHQYWGKIDAVLKKTGTRKVYFSPDGVYNSINLSALYNSASKKFLLDEYEVQLVTNTMDLITRKNTKKIITSAALFGYPDYNQVATAGRQSSASPLHLPTDAVKRGIRDDKLERLKGTEMEVNTIAGLLTQKEVRVDKRVEGQASEEAIRQLDSPHILHIATHGFFLPREAESKKLTGSLSMADLPLSPDDPLLRSGLFLAGAQQALDGKMPADAAEDGILTAYEATNLHLNNTDLVVLSACETGLGEIRNGEGVYGLQRAFQTAGAKAVLMSLWKVDDTATQELMTEFYRQWLSTGSKRGALRAAQATIRAKYPEPYYWGAFVLVGE